MTMINMELKKNALSTAFPLKYLRIFQKDLN